MAGSAKPGVTARLRAFHWLGRQFLAASEGEEKKRVPYGRGDELTQELGGHAPSYLSCARKFAQLYPRGKRLDWICGLGRGKGKPIGPSHVIQLLSVEDQAARDRLATKCAEESWSVVRMRHELAKTRHKKTFGGRQIRVAVDHKLAVVELQFLAERWVRWIAASRTTKDRAGASVYDRLPRRLQKALVDVNTIVEGLNKAGLWAPSLPKTRTRTNTPHRGKQAPTSGRARGRAKAKKRT